MISFLNESYLLYLIFFIPLSVLLSYYFYSKVNINSTKKYLLIALKALYIFLLFFLFLNPLISLFGSGKNNLIDLVLVDNSRSNYISHNGKSKTEQVKNFLQTHIEKNDRFQIFTLAVNNTLELPRPEINDLKFVNYETNYSESINILKTGISSDIINSLTIITDGNYNRGNDPINLLKTYNINTITIGVGDTVIKKDILIESILYNEKVISGNSSIIKSKIKSYLFNGTRAKINLYKENVLIASKDINIQNDIEITDIDFNITENTSGFIKYKIEISTLPDEFISYNNHEEFIIEYLPRNNKILFISGAPGYDNALITDIIKRIQGYNLTFKTQKSPDSFYEGPLTNRINEFDLIILADYPNEATNMNYFNTLSDNIRSLRIPFILLAGKRTEFTKLKNLDNLIPFNTSITKANEIRTNLRFSGVQNEYPIPELIPDLYKNISGIVPKPGSEVLYIDKFGDPLLLRMNTGTITCTAFIGYGFWKWVLNNSSNNAASAEQLFTSLINTNISKEDNKNFYLYSNKKIFDIYEKGVIFANLLDDDGVQIKDAVVKASLYNGTQLINSDLNFIFMENSYILVLPILKPGDYNIEAKAETKILPEFLTDKLRFIVDSTNYEFRQIGSNFNRLINISGNTGGLFFDENAFDSKRYFSFIDSLRNVKKPIAVNSIKERYIFRENVWVLTIIIMLFSIEWIMRKRNNLP